MRNVKLVLEYDGTNYVGWQRQANGRSIQGEIEAALHQILRESVSVIGAGRTDAGVHARGQVANFRTTSSRDCDKIYRGANALLPEEIAMLNVEDVPLAFHARYSCEGAALFLSYHTLANGSSSSLLLACEVPVGR